MTSPATINIPTADESYLPREIGRQLRHRRTSGDMEFIRAAMVRLLDAERPMTCRQLFYRLVSEGVIGKTEAEYKTTVIRLLTEMRRAGVIPFEWITDSTRWMRKPRTYSNLESALQQTAACYRRDLWQAQGTYVELWIEKDALAGVAADITYPWDVPLMVNRGFGSLSFLHSAAVNIAAINKPTFIYYFGDHDPSGVVIDRTVERELRTYAPHADITFHRVAVTEDQIGRLNLPTRPTKTTDSRAKKFTGASVDLDAIPPATLRAMVEECIVGHIDQRQLDKTRMIERQEREALKVMLSNMPARAGGEQ
ncbi:MAG: hypothetical protein NTW19_02730 [Planctomycetota bacterium]|nr:hypothetical protein [Planctomycetota bacterium]